MSDLKAHPMNDCIGLFAAFARGERLTEINSSFSEAFPGSNLYQHQNAVVHKSGGLWSSYENERYHFYIDGDIFFRDTPVAEEVNHNKAFVASFQWSLLSSIKGNFNALLVSKVGNEHYLLTGALGLKPLFSYRRENAVYIADDLRFFKYLFRDIEIDGFALTQALVFNFPLGKTSLLKGVDLLPGGAICNISDKLTVRQWYDVEASISGVRYSRKESLDLIRDKLNKIIQYYIPGEARVGLSLTGGFDGRTILSAMPEKANLTLYTFGSRESSDIRVAKYLSEQLALPHSSFYIDEEYYQSFYPRGVMEFIMRSNGIGAHERTHYLYAFKSLCDQVDFILTGNGGSEVLRTIPEGGIHIPPLAFDLLQTKSQKEVITRAISNTILFRALNLDPFSYVDQLLAAWNDVMLELQHEYQSYRGAYRFVLKESFRKWFGTEMRIEDPYASNRTPFFDEEFLEVLHQTPYSVAYQPFMTRNPVKRKLGQMPYAHIITRNNRRLGRMNTNRGYAPADLTNWWRIPKILYAFLVKKRQNRRNNDYNQFQTAEYFFDRFLDQVNSDLAWVNKKKLREFYTDPSIWKGKIYDFSKVVCWSLWYDKMENLPAPVPPKFKGKEIG